MALPIMEILNFDLYLRIDVLLLFFPYPLDHVVSIRAQLVLLLLVKFLAALLEDRSWRVPCFECVRTFLPSCSSHRSVLPSFFPTMYIAARLHGWRCQARLKKRKLKMLSAAGRRFIPAYVLSHFPFSSMFQLERLLGGWTAGRMQGIRGFRAKIR